MNRRLGRPCGARGEAQKRHVVAGRRNRFEQHGLFQRQPVKLGIVVRRAVEAHNGLEEPAGLGAGGHLVHQPRVAEGELDLGLVDDLGQFACAQHRHGVDDDRASLGRRQPDGDHRGVVGGPDQNPVAGFDAKVGHHRVRQPVGPVCQLLVGAPPAVADERRAVAEAAFDHRIGELHPGVDPLGVVEAIEPQVRPLLGWRQVVPREGVHMRRGAEGCHALASSGRNSTSCWADSSTMRGMSVWSCRASKRSRSWPMGDTQKSARQGLSDLLK